MALAIQGVNVSSNSIQSPPAAPEPRLQFLPGFKLMSWLWEGPDAIYPSEHAARWQIRRMREQLIAAQALASHGGRLLVHPQRFIDVAQAAAMLTA